MKILYIDCCASCPHGIFDTTGTQTEDYWWDEYEKGKTCGCSKMNYAMTQEEFEYFIPISCPLEDA